MLRNASLASRIRPSRSQTRTPTMLESTNRLTPAPNKADAFIIRPFCALRRLRSDAVRLRYQAPRRKRQREAEDLRRQNTVRRQIARLRPATILAACLTRLRQRNKAVWPQPEGRV